MATEVIEPAIRLGEWFTIAAALIGAVVGPIAAIQVQKWLERRQRNRDRREWVFHTLMATRAARTSPDHVQALNMIDLAFYGPKVGRSFRHSEKDQEVLDAWKEYIDSLGENVSVLTDDARNRRWERRDELFFDLLEIMATALRYRFDRVILKKHGYIPTAHGTLEQQQEEFRRGMLSLLAGDTFLKWK